MPRPLQGLIALLLLAGSTPAAQAATEPRVEIPILQRTLSDGTVRYGVPLTIDGAAVEAGLDTGSTGLRLLPDAAPVALTGRRDSYAYSGGVKLDGVLAEAEVGFGEGLGGRIGVHAATRVGCMAQHPRCSAASLPPALFGLMGDGLDGEGFKAVLGLSLAGKPAGNPLRALGVHRWIVSLPRPGQIEPGRLVLDPSDAETRDFTLLPLLARTSWRDDAAHDAVDGCLDDAAAAWRLCGPVLLDTGAGRIALINAAIDPPAVWSGPATLSFAGMSPGMVFTPGQAGARSAIVSGRDPDMPKSMIQAGAAPYLAYDVLYDAERGMIGLRPRAPATGSPGLSAAPPIAPPSPSAAR